jgi:hypothetical protein
MTIKELEAKHEAMLDVLRDKLITVTHRVDCFDREIRYLDKEVKDNRNTAFDCCENVTDQRDMLAECIKKGHKMYRLKMSMSYHQRYAHTMCRCCGYSLTRKANLFERIMANIIEKTKFKGMEL